MMAEAMVQMMEAMGLFAPTPGQMKMGQMAMGQMDANPMDMDPMGMDPMGMNPMEMDPMDLGKMGMNPMELPRSWNPWMSAFTDPELNQTLQQMMAQAPAPMPDTGQDAGEGSTRIDGIWEDPDANLLIVRHHRFRLYSADGGHIEGFIQRRGELIAFLEPDSGSIRVMEVARQNTRLVMRDDLGRVYLYRQLWSEAVPPSP